MAYIITKTDGSTLVTVPDTQSNTDYGITLVGRNYSGYGVFVNDNFVALLENFNKNVPPASPLEGQLWYNPDTYAISLWDDRAWKPLASLLSSSGEPNPLGRNLGDLWWDTANYQLRAWSGQTIFNQAVTVTTTSDTLTLNSSAALAVGDIVTHTSIPLSDQVTVLQVFAGSNQVKISASVSVAGGDPIVFTRGSGWYVIGPSYTKPQGKTGVFPYTVIDNNGSPHQVALVYNKGQVNSVYSFDAEFTPNNDTAIPGFATIKPGHQLRSSTFSQISKTVQADSTGSGGATVIPLADNTDIVAGDYFGSSTVSVDAGIQVINLFANNAVLINTATSVHNNDAVLFQRGRGAYELFHGTSTNSLKFGGFAPDEYARLSRPSRFRANVAINGRTTIGADNNLVIDAPPAEGDVSIFNSFPGGGLSWSATVTQPYSSSANTTATGSVVAGLVVPVTSIQDIQIGDLITVPDLYNLNDAKKVVAKFLGNSSIKLSSTATITAGNIITFYSTHLRAAYIDGTTGHLSVALDPTTANNVVTKYYADLLNTNQTNSLNAAVTAIINGAPVSRRDFAAISNNIDLINSTAASLAADVALKSYINSPTFTGVPAAPTAAPGTNTTQLATTAFVFEANAGLRSAMLANTAAIAYDLKTNYAPLLNPSLQGVPLAPTAAPGTNNTQVATTGYTDNAVNTLSVAAFTQINLRSTIASPTFTGVPAAPTANPTTNTTQLATTAFVFEANTGLKAYSDAILATKAPLISPALVGVPTAPTAAAGDSTTQVATTAFVTGGITTAINALDFTPYAYKASPTFTGTPVAPTAPLGDSTQQLATTAFVQSAINTSPGALWLGSAKTISTGLPPRTSGANGDFWFQV
jgi:hypothetical protein